MTAREIDFNRFMVRDINPWDGPAVFALTGDSKVTRYMGFKTHESVDDATALIATYKDSPSKWQAICNDGEPNDILGIVGLEVQGHAATMTIMIRRDWKARGVGREFGAPFSRWVISWPKIWRLWSYVHVENTAGQRVTERSGAEREGRLRKFAVFPNISDEPQDVYVYGLTR